MRRWFALPLAVLLTVLAVTVPAQTARAAEQADMEITQTAAPDPVAIGSTLTWTILVTNNGPGTADGVEVNDNFNENGTTTEFVSLSSDRGSCTHAESTFNCQIGSMAAGTTATLTLTVTVLSTSSVLNVADVTTSSSDPDWGNNHVTGTVAAGRATDLQLAKTVEPASAAPGDALVYTLTVRNAGPTTASGIQLADTLPAGLEDVTVDPAGSCSVDGADVGCAPAALTTGETFTATVHARIDPAFGGSELTNTATVTSTTPDSDTANNTASATVTVEAASADLAVTKTLDADPLVAGGPLAYTLTVTDDGPADAEDVQLHDTLPAGILDASVSSDLGDCSLTGAAVSCSLGALPAGGVATIAVAGTLDASFSGALTNTATVESSTPDPDDSNNTATATGTATASADLALTKTGSTTTAGNGDHVTYTLRATNNGPSDAPGTIVTDDLPADLAYDAGSCTTGQGSCGASGTSVVFPLGTLAAGATVTMTFSASVSLAAPDEVVTNTASVTSDADDPVPGNNEAASSLNVASAADVSLTKTATSSPAVAGQAIGFTLVAHNAGPGTATGLDLTDALPPGVTIDSITPDAGGCEPPGGTVHCTLPSLAAGSDWTVALSGTLDASAPAGTLRNAATVTSDHDPSPSNDTAVAVVPVVARAALDLSKTGPATVVAGDTLTYALTLENAGPSTAAATTIADVLPAGTTFVSGGGTGIGCTAEPRAPQLVRCSVGALAPGTVALTITVRVDQATPEATVLTNRARASSTTPGPDDGLLATASTTVTAVADLATAKLVQPDLLVAGADAAYLLRVHNAGPSAAASVVVTDDVPAELPIASVAPAGGACTVTGQSVECTRESLPAGATWNIVVRTHVDAGASGPVTNTATATSATTDPDLTDNSGSVTTTISASADLALVKTALFPRVAAGGTEAFFLSAVNTGPSTAEDVTVSDTLPAGLTPVSASGGACSIAGSTVTCQYDSLAAEAVRTTLVIASVDAGLPAGTVTNTATATSPTADPSAANNTAGASVEITTSADLAVVKTADVTDAAPGDTVVYTVAVTDRGPSSAADVTVTDALPAGLALVGVRADPPFSCATAGVTVTCTAPRLDPGTSVITITARIDAAQPDGAIANTATARAETTDPDPSNDAGTATVEVASAPAPGGPGPGTGPGGRLSSTGSNLLPLLPIAGVLLVAGGAVLLGFRRRRA